MATERLQDTPDKSKLARLGSSSQRTEYFSGREDFATVAKHICKKQLAVAQVIEISTPRWPAVDATRFGDKLSIDLQIMTKTVRTRHRFGTL